MGRLAPGIFALHGDDWIAGQLVPVIELGIGAGGDTVAHFDAVIEHGRLAPFVDKTVAAKDALFRAVGRGEEAGWVVTPVE